MSSTIARTRAMWAYFSSLALAATGYIALVTVTPLVAEDLLGSPRWSGLPSSVAVIGTAFGTSLLARLMARRGRRFGLVSGYLVASVSAIGVLSGLVLQNFALLAAAMFCLGAGYGASRLTRYAAADLYPRRQRASAISWILWAGTIGSVLGPNLLEPTKRYVESLDLPAAAGGYSIACVTMLAAALLLRWMVPSELESVSIPEPSADDEPTHDSGAWRRPLRAAVVVMVISQTTMLLVMTMTPIELRSRGFGFGFIGLVMSAHTLGMYALAPVTGYLADRWGRIPVAVSGCILLSTAGLLAATAAGGRIQLVAALFFLGLGWNFGFVSGSALLTDRVPAGLRIRIQGTADSIVWSSAALATVGSGLLVGVVGYPGLGAIALVMSWIPLVVLFVYRRSLVADSPVVEQPQEQRA